MALNPLTPNTRRFGNAAAPGTLDPALLYVIAGALVTMALVRFQPKTGGYVLLALTLLLLIVAFRGGTFNAGG